jgi:Ulp1 family protease
MSFSSKQEFSSFHTNNSTSTPKKNGFEKTSSPGSPSTKNEFNKTSSPNYYRKRYHHKNRNGDEEEEIIEEEIFSGTLSQLQNSSQKCQPLSPVHQPSSICSPKRNLISHIYESPSKYCPQPCRDRLVSPPRSELEKPYKFRKECLY